MSETGFIQLVTILVGAIVVIVPTYFSWRAKEAASKAISKVDALKVAVNGRLTQLLEAVAARSKLEARKDVIEEIHKNGGTTPVA